MTSPKYSIAGMPEEDAKYDLPDNRHDTKNTFQNHLGYVAEGLVERTFVNWKIFQTRNPEIKENIISNANIVLKRIYNYLFIKFQNESFLSNPDSVPIQFEWTSTSGVTFTWKTEYGIFLFMVSESDFTWSFKRIRHDSISDIRLVQSNLYDISQALDLMFDEIG